MRIGFVGTGYIAGVVAAALRETGRVQLAAVASRTLAQAQSFALAHAALVPPRPFGDWREMLAWDGIDAVYLAAPTTTRTAMAIAAASRGKPKRSKASRAGSKCHTALPPKSLTQTWSRSSTYTA